MLDAVVAHRRAELVEEAQPRVAQVERVDRVRRHRQRRLPLGHHLLALVAEDGGAARAVAGGDDAVEVDEQHRVAVAVDVGGAVAQAGADGGEVGVGVLRLLPLLLVAELASLVELVVLVVGALGKDLLEDLDVGVDVLAAVAEAGAEALLEEARGRVVRAVEPARIALERVAVLIARRPPYVDDVIASLRAQAQIELDRRRHGGVRVTRRWRSIPTQVLAVPARAAGAHPAETAEETGVAPAATAGTTVAICYGVTEPAAAARNTVRATQPRTAATGGLL